MHVKQIFGLGAEKQVVGPHAPWYITGVANLQPSRNRTVLQFPTKAMRSGVTTVYPERAVTVLSGALPKPTVLASLHPSPKAHFRYDHGAYCREEN
jgi:hypothetical protein